MTFLPWICFAVLFVLLIFVLTKWAENRENNIRDNGFEAEGVVVDSVIRRTRDSRTYDTYVKYIGNDGKEHVGLLNTAGNIPIHRKIRIRYLSSDYEHVIFVSQQLGTEVVENKTSNKPFIRYLKYQYAITETTFEEWVCYDVGVFILLLAAVFNTECSWIQSETAYKLFSTEWFLSLIKVFLFSVFVCGCGFLYRLQNINFRKWQKKIIKTGIKSNGQILEVKVITNVSYQFLIRYYSELEQKEVTFWTDSVIIQDLNKNADIICDIYELQSKEEIIDYDSEMIQINEQTGEINMSINPLKLFSTVFRKYNRKNFGNRLAVEFRCID